MQGTATQRSKVTSFYREHASCGGNRNSYWKHDGLLHRRSFAAHVVLKYEAIFQIVRHSFGL